MTELMKTKKFTNPNEITEDSNFKEAGLILCFYGSDYKYKDLYNSLLNLKVPFLGCMDIARLEGSSYHFETDSAVAMAFSKELFERVIITSYDMRKSSSYDSMFKSAEDQFKKGMKNAGINASSPDLERDFAINLLYGLQSANSVLNAQNGLSLFLQSVGGSSGGKLDFVTSSVICSKGMGSIGATAFVRLKPEYYFTIDRVSSFEQVHGQLVATKLESPRHIIEFNGKPAKDEYCNLVGKSPEELGPSTFAMYTLGVDPGDGEKLITSIMMGDKDKGLLTYNDVGQGTSFNVYKALTQFEDRKKKLQNLPINSMVGYISFDCVLCYLARDANHEIEKIAALYNEALPGIPKLGFGTFSENICGANVNQTETFIAIFKR